MSILSNHQEDQIEAIAEDIRNSFSEDITFTSPEQVIVAVERLKAKLTKIADHAETYIYD